MQKSGHWVAVFVLVFLAAVSLTGCSHESITLDLTHGPVHSLVVAQGSGPWSSKVIWDSGRQNREIPGGVRGDKVMFSVPHDATEGSYEVAIEKLDGSRSSTKTFTVTQAPKPFGKPRIDHVMLFEGTSFTASNVTATLLVQGANIDVGAAVLVSDATEQSSTELRTVAYKWLRNNLRGVEPKYLGYPIYHYVALRADLGSRPAGSEILITVRNLDGEVNDEAFRYILPVSRETLDSDGDSLPDIWETDGYDFNGNGITENSENLRAQFNTDPYRRDILLEIDVMDAASNRPVLTTPGSPGTFDTARAVFAAAPIMNPDTQNRITENGINLYIEIGTIGSPAEVVGLEEPDNPPFQANFGTLKAANFDNATRDNVFHYAIWANGLPDPTHTGASDVDYTKGSGDDFLIGFEDTIGDGYRKLRQVEALVHELGHNLGQRHGGDDNSQYKPNYLSVMSYTWQFRTTETDEWRRMHPTCLPFYYGAWVTEPNGALPPNATPVVDYSEGMAADLNENSLSEPKGVCGQPVHWNDNGNQSEEGVGANANHDDEGDSSDNLKDFANWRALRYDGPARDGKLLDCAPNCP